MKRTKVDMSTEKSIITGAILSERFLRELIPIYHQDLIEIPYGSIVIKWCIEYFNTYGKAPVETIEDIYDTWAKNNPNEEQAKFIKGFLATLSDEYEHAEKFNAEYLMDKTVAYFKARSYKILAEDLDYYLSKNDIESAENSYRDFQKIEKTCSPGIDIFDDEDAWRNAFDTNTETLFKVPGRLGELINTQLTRDSFISLMAVAKLGKSWNLEFLANQAIRARCNVAKFQVGDLSQSQTMMRTGIFLTQRSNKTKYCGKLLIPVVDCENNQKNLCGNTERRSKVGCYTTDGIMLDPEDAKGYVPCNHCHEKQGYGKGTEFKGTVWYNRRRPVRVLTWQEAYAAAQDFKKVHKAKRYKLSTHTSRSLSVTGIIQQLDAWERLEGWIPDVVIIDYADILAPERKGNKESRDDVNETWMALRGLSQSKHCCVITATQANGAAIKEKTVSREHYSSDRRKFDHVTAMYGLSQTPEEKRKGIVRWGAIVVREDEFDVDAHVNVIGSLAIGRPYLNSW